MGYELGPREIAAAMANGSVLPGVVGTIASVVDPQAAFIQTGAQNSLPQKAGISGTTCRFMEAALLVGGSPELSRLAMLGARPVIDAHTVYEIANAANGFVDIKFAPQNPPPSLSLPGELLEEIALGAGTTLAELYGETKKSESPTSKWSDIVGIVSDGPHLVRLSRIFELRDAPLDLLGAVESAGTANVMVGVSALTCRFAMSVPYHPEALRVVAPDVPAPTVSGDAMLVIDVDAGRRTASLTIAGLVNARAAVEDVAPPGARNAWLATIGRLTAAGGVISNRTRCLTEERAAIRLRFAQRAAAADTLFQDALTTLMGEVSMPDTHRAAWNRVYEAAGQGAGVALRTECVGGGLAPRLGMMFGIRSWDRAIDFTIAVSDLSLSRDAAVTFGILSGELGLEPRGAELVLDGDVHPDVMVWAYLRQDG